MSAERDDFGDWEARIESVGPQGWLDAELFTPDFPNDDPPLDFANHVDLAAGEFFRNTWRRRLDDAHGDCGYVARQMRKAGVPMELALMILLAPAPRPAPGPASVSAFDTIGDGTRASANDGPAPNARPLRQLLAEAA